MENFVPRNRCGTVIDEATEIIIHSENNTTNCRTTVLIARERRIERQVKTEVVPNCGTPGFSSQSQLPIPDGSMDELDFAFPYDVGEGVIK